MSKTTRSLEKAQSETLSQKAASAKDREKEKNFEPKPYAASKKQAADDNYGTSSAQAGRDSEKKASANKKSASNAKTRVSQVPVQISRVSDEDAPSKLLRRTKTTASALAQLEKGIEAVHRKDFKKAFTELQSLLEKYPNEADIAVRARSYLNICKRGEANQKKTPLKHDQTYALGVLEHNRNNYDKAIACFRQSLERHPQADYIYYSIAASLALKGDVFKAIENLHQAVELNNDSRIHAKNDPDFAALEHHKEFQELIGISVPRQGRGNAG